MYGMVYGMVRTTVYLPEDLKAELERTATATGRSEAELIRDGVRAVLDANKPGSPRVPLFRSGIPDLAERADELLAGFGSE